MSDEVVLFTVTVTALWAAAALVKPAKAPAQRMPRSFAFMILMTPLVRLAIRNGEFRRLTAWLRRFPLNSCRIGKTIRLAIFPSPLPVDRRIHPCLQPFISKPFL
ncbi:hypothetical protein [Azospirillum sp. B510]|uniref:hypothetical protein n=1 Tax=Azospirillum sp. (strain B510) TaxID=137722 RepID=UPI0005A906F7|nr:hypothetical protein [Azospirillum sp. B510]